MKLSHIAFVVVAAICAVGAAQAAPQTVWSAGSSSSTKAQFKAFKSNCVGGNVHIYINSSNAVVTADSLPGDTGTGNFYAYQCTFDVTKIGPGMAATYGGQSVTLFHTVDRGSFMAFAPYLPFSNPNRVPNLRRISVAASTGCTVNFPPSVLNPGVTVHKGCTISDPPIEPDGGFLDMEKEFWPQSLGTNFVISFANVGQLFGVVVTDELYKAMQVKQVADGLLPGCTLPPPATPPDFTPDPCQPSISPEQYRSIISTGCGGCPWQTDWQPLVGLPGANHVVNLCRRVHTSGTQTASNAFFLENPCRQWPILTGQLTPQDSTATNPNYIVTEGSGTVDVKTCLNNSNNNANVNNKFAIGVMSMENEIKVGDNFKFVKLGGTSGNINYVSGGIPDSIKQRAAGAKGLYPFMMEMVYVVHVNARQAFFDELAGDLADPSLDLAGLFVLPQAPLAGTPDGDKVGYGTKFNNNCQPQQLFFF